MRETEAMHNDCLGSFLRSRREGLRPEAAGIAVIGQRRTPGLRREEVAYLADLSADYYTRLEQGRGGKPSAPVLDALARALRLPDHERAYVFELAEQYVSIDSPEVEEVRPSVQRILQALEPNPGVVLGTRLDVLAWNAPAAAAIFDFGTVADHERNIGHLTFLDAGYRARLAEPEGMERAVAATLAEARAKLAGDERFEALVGRLSTQSTRFAELWGGHGLKERTGGRKAYLHPVEGALSFTYEGLRLPDAGDRWLMVHLPADEATARALERLAGAAGAPVARTHTGVARGARASGPLECSTVHDRALSRSCTRP